MERHMIAHHPTPLQKNSENILTRPTVSEISQPRSRVGGCLVAQPLQCFE